VHVALADRAYDVHIGAGLLASLGERVRDALHKQRTGGTPTPPAMKGQATRRAAPPGNDAQRAFLAYDDNLPDSLVETAAASLTRAGFIVTTHSVHASEQTKSLDTLASLLEALASATIERSDPVIALGGGVVGDVAGFAAAIYRRGAPVVQCPTTLLAMVDASVGGKTAVNLRVDGQLRKNMVGAFWQPALVLCDVAALDSLPDRQLRAGLAECVKHALIARSTPARDRLGSDATDVMLAWTEESIPKVLARDREALIAFITRNITVKTAVVEADEREEADDAVGGRALLNLGHTFAHAIEPLHNISPTNDPADAPLLHGEAVALGLIAASACARALGMIDAKQASQTSVIVAKAGLPTCVANLPIDETLLSAMAHDKKQQDGQMRLVLPAGPGLAKVMRNPPADAVQAGLAAIRA